MSLRNCLEVRRSFLLSCRNGLMASCILFSQAAPGFSQDRPGPYQAYPLQHTSADEIVGRLRKLAAESAPEAQVFSDVQANQVLVVGPPATQKLIAGMLANLDQAPTPAQTPAADPSSGREVKGHRVDGDLAPLVAKLQERFPANLGVRFVADDRTRQVIVIGPPAVQQQVTEFLQGGNAQVSRPAAPSDARPASPMQGTSRVHKLTNVTWRELEAELVRLWGEQLDVTRTRNGEVVSVAISGAAGSQPVMQIDRRSGEVKLTGSERAVDQWGRVLEAIDSPRDGNRLTQLLPIRNADWNMLQSTVALLNQGTAPDEDEVIRGVVPTARRRSAADLVSALLQQPGGAAQPAAPAPAGTQPVANQPAPGQPAPGQAPADDSDLGLIGSVQIEIINDMIVLRGNRRDVERVKRLIEEIDEISRTTRPVVEVYHMKYVNGEATTTLVSELYTEILTDLTGRVTIRALAEPNAILLIGRKESLDLVKELIDKLDQPMPASGRFEVFRLKHVSAVDAEQTIRNFFVNRPGFDTNPRNVLGARLQVIADFRTNSLIIQASPRDMEEARRLIESIDVEEGGPSSEVKIFKLRNALADTLATVIQSAITGQAAAAAGGQQAGGQAGGQAQQGGTTTQSQARLPSTSLQFKVIDQNGDKLLRSGILADVQVTADASTNSLIVRAPSKSMELIAAFIEQLDKLPDANAVVKVFTIMNGNATSLAQMLQTLFGQQVTAGQGAQNALGGLFGAAQQLQTGTAGGESSLIPLRFAVEQRTNSIIASGSESDLQVVDTLLLRLDEELDDRRLAVVRLRNTQAASVATAIQTYLTNLQQQVQQQLLSNQSISAFESVERQVFVIPENVTNSLVVSATPRFQEEILRVIEELDVRPPMVMVQVLLAEITLSNTVEFGTEFGLQDSMVFDRGRAVNTLPGSQAPGTPGFNFNASPVPAYPNTRSYFQDTLAGQSLTNFAVGRSNTALGYSGLVLTAANESVNILLRALHDEGRLQILSRPQVMSMHNQPAYVQVGQDVARITGTNVTTGVVTQNVEDVPTGLILSILPLINDDGVIVMGIEAERSALGSDADGTTISSGTGGDPIIIKPINRTKASTTISARDGQTVVFAGLITKTDEIQLRRIPYLSDVPVVGNLFKFESNFERRTELLIVMTPHLIRDEADAELLKAQETERMSWCLADVVNLTGGELGLQGGSCAFCKTDVPTIYPDSDPTGVPVPAGPPGSELVARPPVNPAPFSTGFPSNQLLPLPEIQEGRVDPATGVLPIGESQRPTTVTYGPPLPGVTRAAYRSVRLPTPQ